MINENTNKYHGFYDKDIKDILGREKEGEQKTYELNKVILGEHKDLLVKSAALQTRVTELEGMKGSDANLEELKRVRKELAEVREGVELSKTEWEKEKAGFNTTIASTKVQGVLNRGLSDIKWKPEYSKTIREQIVRNGQASLIENSDTVDGVTVFLDKDKKVRRGPDNVTALTAEEVQREDFADMILGEKKQEGTGGKPGENIDAETMVLPITVKTKGDLTKHLIEVCGFARNTPEYKMLLYAPT